MKDNIRDYILEQAELIGHERVLLELVKWLDWDTLQDFKETSFGNEGL